ncbi:MAG: 50S ribosomal protein L18 [Candidatus Makana argininalis]
MKKKKLRLKRSKKTRFKIKSLNSIRLTIHKTSKHIYAQIISSNNSKVLVSASTVEKKIKNKIKITGNKNAAMKIGEIIAKRSINKNIKQISFDRSGFKYHGRIKLLADYARKYGLIF